jgi:hypothetical protein
VPTLAELLDPDDKGADEVRELLARALNPVEVFRSDRSRGERALLRVEAPTSTPLGAVAYRLGGLVFDHGWVRLLGSGSPRMARDLVSWNGPLAAPRLGGALLVGDDLVGGFFAVDRGAFGGPLGHVRYRAPGESEWEDLDIDYRGLLDWACNGDLDSFYEDARWPGWEVEALGVGVNEALDLDPPLDVPAAERTRKRVHVEAAWRRP